MPKDILKMMDEVESRSSDKTKTYVNLALNYGGRAEIVKSVKEIAEDYGITESKVKMSLLRSRNQLKAALEKEGIAL